jgi:predicted Rossmann fold flavoprotein
MTSDKDVIVIGAGAAGLLCAIEAGKRGRSVLVLERSEKIGKKIRISGGGRCNFTNLYASPENYLSDNRHFCKSALARYTPQDFLRLVERHGIAYHEKKLGQLFCDKTSEEIIRLLEAECASASVEIQTGVEVSGIARDGDFSVTSNRGVWSCSSLVVATGGLSIPKMGATDFGYRIARQFGLRIIPCRPALVPFVWNKEDLRAYGELAGVSLPVVISYGSQEFTENILFTHKGLSGPAVLQISSYWKPGDPCYIDLLPGQDLMDEFMQARGEGKDLPVILARYFPKRFAQKWTEHNVPAKPMSHRSGRDIKDVLARLHRWKIVPAGTEGYEKAEVTAGGIDTAEFSSQTMECRKVPGLYGVGEVLDVTGQLGGYNFQWAWASGFAAGQAV